MISTALPQVAEARHETVQTSVRELDHSGSDGIDVTLHCDRLTNRVSVVIRDERLGESLAFGVDPAEALCAFHHPYAIAGNLAVADGHQDDLFCAWPTTGLARFSSRPAMTWAPARTHV